MILVPSSPALWRLTGSHKENGLAAGPGSPFGLSSVYSR